MSFSEAIEKFEKDGYSIIPDFATDEEVQQMKDACHKIIADMDPEKHTKSVFSGVSQDHATDKYFLESGDKVQFFFDKEALNDKGELKVDKHLALNKMGHALHWYIPEFRKFTFSDKLKKLVQEIGYKDPAVIQSMYIFKQPNFGEEVVPHKDATFLQTFPDSCMGFWIALEDATKENGCLWFSPGSHKQPTRRRFVRNSDEKGPLLVFKGELDEDDPSSYLPVEVKKGTLVLIHGQVNHKSAKNTSKYSRNIYTFHVIEQRDTIWGRDNWLQPTEDLPFTKLFEN